MLDKSNIKCLNTTMLRKAASHAKRNSYNRQLDKVMLKALDADGIHLAYSLMLHEHAQGVAVDPHLRCKVLLALTDREAPVEMLLDFTITDYDRWPTVADYEAADAAVTKDIEGINA